MRAHRICPATGLRIDRQAELQIQIAVAVGAELLVGDEEHVVDLLPFVELVDETVEGGHQGL